MNEPVRSTGGCERLGSGMRVSGIRGLSFAAWARGLAFIVLFGMLGSAGAQAAAPRNLLIEFRVALYNLDVKKVKALLQEGIDLSDAAMETVKTVQSVSLKSIETDLDYKKPDTQRLDELCIEIINSVVEAGGKGNNVFLGALALRGFSDHEDPRALSDYETLRFPSIKYSLPIFQSFLDAVGQTALSKEKTGGLFRVLFPEYCVYEKGHLLGHTSYSDKYREYREFENPQYKRVEKLGLLAKLADGNMPDWPEAGVIKNCLNRILCEVKQNTYNEQIVKKDIKEAIEVIHLLEGAGAGLRKGDVEGELKDYRTQNRNKPELLAFADELEKACTIKTYWWESSTLWWVVGIVVCVLVGPPGWAILLVSFLLYVFGVI